VKSELRLRGRYDLKLFNGIYLCERQYGDNLIVNTGLNNIAEIFLANSGTPARATHIAFGTDATPAAAGQTALFAEVLTRGGWFSAARASNVLTFIAIYTNISGTSPTIQEIGIFNAAAGGAMYSRIVPQKFVFSDGYAVGFTWTVEFGV